MHRNCGAGWFVEWLRRWYRRAASYASEPGKGLLMQDCSQPVAGVFVGVDVAKGNHYACALSARGDALFSRPVSNDEGAVRRLIEYVAVHGSPALVVDTTSSVAVLVLGVAAECQIPVAYVSGLVMRRAADLYAGAAKTDPKDAQVLADYAWRNADRLTWTTVTDELLARLRILNGRDTDLAWGRDMGREPPT